MAKQKKKRTKKYSGADAASNRPIVTRVSAVNRTKLGQWWFERKRVVKPVLIAALVITIIVWLIISFIQMTQS